MEGEGKPRLWWKLVALKGCRLVLVPYQPEHVLVYHSWMQDPQMLELTGSEPLSLEAEFQMQRSWSLDADKCTFIILDKQRCKDFSSPAPHVEAMVGDVGMFMNDPEDHTAAEIEIMIAEPECRGKGLGREAVKMLMGFAFNYLGIRTFTAKIGESNQVSIHLFKSLGFRDESHSSVFKQVTLRLTPEVLPQDFDIVD